MNTLDGILLILVGLISTGVGLLLFYTMLPLFYALFGLGAGYWLGGILTGAPAGEMSVIKSMFALGGGTLFAVAAYFLEPYRRTLIGIGLGSLVGASVGNALGLTGISGVVVMAVSAVIGAGITLALFDVFVIIASADRWCGSDGRWRASALARHRDFRPHHHRTGQIVALGNLGCLGCDRYDLAVRASAAVGTRGRRVMTSR